MTFDEDDCLSVLSESEGQYKIPSRFAVKLCGEGEENYEIMCFPTRTESRNFLMFVRNNPAFVKVQLLDRVSVDHEEWNVIATL
jgi:hypothetical protein